MVNMKEKFERLKALLREASDIESASAVLHWDQSTYMPPGGAAARGRQIATLDRIAHEKLTAPVIGELLEVLRPFEAEHPNDSDEAALLRATRREYEKAIRVPSRLVAERSAHAAASYAAWVKARPANDFAAVRPYLEKTVDLSRQLADCFPGYEHVADPLIDFVDYGMKAETIRALFADLRAGLTPLVHAITRQPPADDSCLHRHYPAAAQLAFGQRIIEQFGYDFQRGRLDQTAHPYMTKFSQGDVRITTRVDERDLSQALFSTLHESGHALYEQGIDPAYEATPLGGGVSAGIHESQSRLWENQVGRSRGFWEHGYPPLQQTFPGVLDDVSLDRFYRAINTVRRSPIRTDADEVTYNLHVMLRFDLELALLEGKLAVRDLPEAWRGRFEADFGIPVPDDRDGVLQDVHWFGGLVGGAFQGYTLGNLLSAQFFRLATAAHPDIPARMARGQFATLRDWLREHLYVHGSKYTAPELIERVTGGPLRIDPYMAYLREKYGELYDL
jgi:carboxypeptidase Taq